MFVVGAHRLRSPPQRRKDNRVSLHLAKKSLDSLFSPIPRISSSISSRQSISHALVSGRPSLDSPISSNPALVDHNSPCFSPCSLLSRATSTRRCAVRLPIPTCWWAQTCSFSSSNIRYPVSSAVQTTHNHPPWRTTRKLRRSERVRIPTIRTLFSWLSMAMIHPSINWCCVCNTRKGSRI